MEVWTEGIEGGDGGGGPAGTSEDFPKLGLVVGGGLGKSGRDYGMDCSYIMLAFFLKCKGSNQENRNHASYFKYRSFNPGNCLYRWRKHSGRAKSGY